MAFVDFVRSVYQDQHKAKPLAFTSVEEGKNVRIQKQAKERRSRRIDAFASNRAMEEDDSPLTPQLDIPATKKDVTDPRKKQMLLWKQERMKRKKLEPKQPPPFKVGVVRHAIAPFQENIFKNPTKPITVQEPPLTNQRVTRATTRANLKAPLIVQKPPVQQKSFAPPNAKFHAPKVNIVERKNQKFKYTPRKPKLGEINNKLFSNLFPSTQGAKKSPKILNNRNLRGKKEAPMNVRKMSAKKRKSIKDEFLVELIDKDLKDHGINMKSSACSPSTPRTTPQGIKQNGSVPKVFENGVNIFASPEPSNPDSDLLISSPFVTVGRGKVSRQRESAVKLKFGYSHMSPEKTAQYFRLQLDSEIARLQVLCDRWKTYRDENEKTLTEDSNDLINLAIGQTQLLISKKLEQFRGLVRQCENREQREGEGIVTVPDLQGFWDMVYMQVENVDVRFQNLEEKKNKNWEEEEILPAVTKSKKKQVSKAKPSTKSSSGLKAMIMAARMKSKVDTPVSAVPTKQTLTPKDADTMTFNGGFFSVISPVKNKQEENHTPGKRVSMLKTVVASEAKKRLSTKTPPSTAAILKASCLAKNVVADSYNSEIPVYAVTPVDLNKTPGKSILKTPGTLKKATSQNSRRSIKVLFANDCSSEEEMTPPTRKSIRLSVSKNADDIYSDVAIIQAGVLETMDVGVEITKPSKRQRLTRQKAISNDENVEPSLDVEMKSTPNKRRKRKSIRKEALLNAGVDNEENITQYKSKSRTTRLTQDFQTDLKLSDSAIMKKMDDRLSFNLISFSPDPSKVARSTRYTLRRKSTQSPAVQH